MRPLPRTGLLVGGLLAAWLGAWGAWLAHPMAGLTQSALDMAQVAQRLPDVLYGRLGGMLDLLRASVGLACVALSMGAGRLRIRGLRWSLHGLALLLAVRLLPPYPQLLDLWRSPDYGGRFVVATLTLAGWVVTLTNGRWPDVWRQVVTPALGLAALVSGLWAYLALQRSFVTATQLPFAPGWGLVFYAIGLLTATVVGLLGRPAPCA